MNKLYPAPRVPRGRLHAVYSYSAPGNNVTAAPALPGGADTVAGSGIICENPAAAHGSTLHVYTFPSKGTNIKIIYKTPFIVKKKILFALSTIFPHKNVENVENPFFSAQIFGTTCGMKKFFRTKYCAKKVIHIFPIFTFQHFHLSTNCA